MNPFIIELGQPRYKIICTNPKRCLDMFNGMCVGDSDCPHLGFIMGGKLCRYKSKQPIVDEEPVKHQRKKYTVEQENIIMEYYSDMTSIEIGEIVGLDALQVRHIIARLRKDGRMAPSERKGYGKV